MKKTIAFTIALLATSQSYAQCIGSGEFQTCIDVFAGTRTEIQRIGSTSFIEGSNPSTGETWSGTEQDLGNIQLRSGRTGDGRAYNSTTHDMGSIQMIRSFIVGGETINCMVTPTTVICN